MADFNKAIPITLQWEGGYVNNPNDPGGETNRGIILSVWKKNAHLCGCVGTSDELKKITEDQAKVIYKAIFWNGILGDEIIRQDIANQVFDTYVNCGSAAIVMLQHVLNKHAAGLVADGIFGQKTLDALNSCEFEIAHEYKAARIAYYQWLPTVNPKLSIFLAGWLRRANAF